MISNEQARTYAKASNYFNNPQQILASGYTVVDTGNSLINSKTGFEAVILRKTGTTEYTIVFRGTQFDTSQEAKRKEQGVEGAMALIHRQGRA